MQPGTQEGGGQPKSRPRLYSRPALHSLTWRKTQKRVLCQWAGVERALFAMVSGWPGAGSGAAPGNPLRCCLLEGAVHRTEPGGWAGWGRAPGSPSPTSATSFLPGSGPAGSCLVALPQDDALGSVLQPLIQHGGRELRLQARPTGFESLLCHPLAGEYGVISHLTISVSSSLQWGNDSTYTYRVNSRIKCENAYKTTLDHAQDRTKHVDGA